MESKPFFDLVVKMRQAQRNYFKFRNNSYLRESKRFEKEIDAEIERVRKIMNEKNNPRLFK